MHGGDLVADVFQAQGVRFVYTLTGGHIAPILVSSKQRGIRIIDTRHEATTVFAADATARLSGVPGVAVVTAGPGVTNTLTAIKNAQLAQSPLVLVGGAAATALRGRGALQDIDQLSLLRSAVKWQSSVRRVRDIVPTLQEAFHQARSGTPGPVFVELPIDLLYDEALVRQWYGMERGGRTLADRLTKQYLALHVRRLFAGANAHAPQSPRPPEVPVLDAAQVQAVAARLRAAERPLLLVGSQALVNAASAESIAAAVARLGLPVYLSGMARGLLGKNHPLQRRHRRREALREADLIILAGVPADFRLDYGNHIPRRALYVSANRSRADLTRNRRPDIALHGDAGLFLQLLATHASPSERWDAWQATLRQRDTLRDEEIGQQARAATSHINPLHLCRELAGLLPDNSVLVADGGDFVATASYILSPPGPLTWLDPGPFGTLGVGAGFALAAKLVRPESEVWLLYGDGSAGYSLAEFDTFVRHGILLIGLVGNDAGWTQIAREQVEYLKDDVATVLAYSDYERVAEGFGAAGLRVDDPELVADTLAEARRVAAAGRPVLVNAILGKSDFRKGSISM